MAGHVDMRGSDGGIIQKIRVTEVRSPEDFWAQVGSGK